MRLRNETKYESKVLAQFLRLAYAEVRATEGKSHRWRGGVLRVTPARSVGSVGSMRVSLPQQCTMLAAAQFALAGVRWGVYRLRREKWPTEEEAMPLLRAYFADHERAVAEKTSPFPVARRPAPVPARERHDTLMHKRERLRLCEQRIGRYQTRLKHEHTKRRKLLASIRALERLAASDGTRALTDEQFAERVRGTATS